MKTKIRINPQAREYIKENNIKFLRLYLSSCGSWSSVIYQPQVSVGRPEKEYNFFRIKIDGIEIFVEKYLLGLADILEISLEKLKVSSFLILKGLKEF